MAADFSIKKGDTRPALAATLKDNDVAIDLTNATSVLLLAKRTTSQAGTPDISGTCTFVNRPAGQISYTWAAGNTSIVGIYNLEFQITWNDGGVETVPNDVPPGHSDAYYTLEVKQDLS